jgi:hypothetical protein
MMAPSTDRQRPGWFRIGPDPTMRVSDAERAEVTDQLARHYGDGRLDQAELDERASRAVAATTFGDLQGLLDDLPPLADGTPFGAPKVTGAPIPATCHAMKWHQRGPLRAVLAAVLLIVTACIWPGLWIVFLATAFVIVSKNRHHHGRRPTGS